MPSEQALPSIATLLDIAGKAMRGEDARQDAREGSGNELLYGPSAVLFAQQARRDREMFRANQFNSARGKDLTRYVRDVFAMERDVALFGTGTAILSRASVGAGAGTVYAGTRLHLRTPSNMGAFYVVTTDAAVGASDTFVTVNIRATFVGETSAVDTTTGGIVFDALWDSTWQVSRLTCSAGQEEEKDADFRARVHTAWRESRKGYVSSMRRALLSAGASRVVLFPSTYGNVSDYGINACYVADPIGNSSTSLIQSCVRTLESWRVCGADLYVGGMAPALLTFTATITLASDPGGFDVAQLYNEMVRALQAYLKDPQQSAAYKRDAMASVIARTSKAIRDVSISAPASDATLTAAAWPASLPQAYVNAGSVSIALQGPT